MCPFEMLCGGGEDAHDDTVSAGMTWDTGNCLGHYFSLRSSVFKSTEGEVDCAEGRRGPSSVLPGIELDRSEGEVHCACSPKTHLDGSAERHK